MDDHGHADARQPQHGARHEQRDDPHAHEQVLHDHAAAGAREREGVRELAEVVRHEGNVSGLKRHVARRAAHGDGDVRLGHGGSVVDAVAHDDHAVMAPLELGHDAGLVLRQEPRVHLVQPQLGADGARHALVVARQHHEALHPEPAQFGDGRGRLRPRLVAHGEQAGQDGRCRRAVVRRAVRVRVRFAARAQRDRRGAAYRHEARCLAGPLELGRARLGRLRHAHARRRHELAVAYEHRDPVHCAGHAVPAELGELRDRREVGRDARPEARPREARFLEARCGEDRCGEDRCREGERGRVMSVSRTRRQPRNRAAQDGPGEWVRAAALQARHKGEEPQLVAGQRGRVGRCGHAAERA